MAHTGRLLRQQARIASQPYREIPFEVECPCCNRVFTDKGTYSGHVDDCVRQYLTKTELGG